MLNSINNWLDKRFLSEPESPDKLDETIKKFEFTRMLFLFGVAVFVCLGIAEFFLLDDNLARLDTKFSMVLFLVLYVIFDIHTKLFKMQRQKFKKQ